MRGKFITLEGLDGAGKSTHSAWLAEFLEARGIVFVSRASPAARRWARRCARCCSTAISACTRNRSAAHVRRAARASDKIVLPALERGGTWVLCDRFTDASYAYQAGGSGVDWDKIAALEAWVHRELQPDLTLYFDVSPEIGRSRAAAIKTPDRYEQEREAFHARVRAGYLRRALEHPQADARHRCEADPSATFRASFASSRLANAL